MSSSREESTHPSAYSWKLEFWTMFILGFRIHSCAVLAFFVTLSHKICSFTNNPVKFDTIPVSFTPPSTLVIIEGQTQIFRHVFFVVSNINCRKLMLLLKMDKLTFSTPQSHQHIIWIIIAHRLSSIEFSRAPLCNGKTLDGWSFKAKVYLMNIGWDSDKVGDNTWLHIRVSNGCVNE